MYRNFLLAGMVVVVLVAPAMAEENDPDYCGPPGATFAHCKGHVPVFKTVAMTIHGWNGSCKSTFGKDDKDGFGSIYSLFRGKRFFDLDCFSYDSDSFPIEEHVKNLGVRLEKLKKMGYENVMFITHSTGGIIALNYLVNRLDKAIRTDKFDTITVPTVIAWATPIKGLRWDIVAAGNALNFFGATQKILPQLDDENPYLGKLRDRLKEYRTKLCQIPLKWLRHYDTHVEFFQGMSADWVVKSIEVGERNGGWIWESPYGELTNIDVGHLANIGDPGNPVIHKYPGSIVDSKAIDSLPLKLNQNKIFPLNRPVYDDWLLPLQIVMVKGVSYHAARVQLRSDVNTFIRFLSRILLNEFPRAKEVDYMLLNALKNRVFSNHLIDTNKTVRAGVIRFVREVIGKYNSTTEFSKRSPGFGEPEFIRGVLNFAGQVDIALNQVPVTIPGVTEARVKLGALMLKSLGSLQRKVQEISIKLLSVRAPSFPDVVVKKTNLVEKLIAYYTPRAGKLGATAKERIGLTILSMSERGGDIGLRAAAFMNKEVTFSGKAVPAWKSFQSKKLDTEIIRAFERIQRKKSEAPGWKGEWAVTYGGISAFAGSKGNQQELVKAGHEKGFTFYKELPEIQRKKVDKKILKFGQPKPEKGYYFLQKKYNPTNWSNMITHSGNGAKGNIR